MARTVVKSPINLIQFVSIENENFLVSLSTNQETQKYILHVQGLFAAALSGIGTKEDNFVIYKLLVFAHYHFLFSTSCLMRCHLSEAFASARAAIDASLIAAQIIHDRSSQVAYLDRKKPFDALTRHFGNLIKDGKPLPHHWVPTLMDLHKKFSSVGSHADINVFAHRVNIDKESKTFTVDYFQRAESDIESKIHMLIIIHTFVVVIDVFSDFLVTEEKVLPIEWQNELQRLGSTIEAHRNKLRSSL